MRNDKYAVSRLHNKVTFGHEGSTGKVNPNTGEPIKGFVGDKTVHCGNYTISTTQAISLAGASFTNDVLLVVRQDKDLTDMKKYPKAMYNGEEYRVAGWSIDDELNAYNVVTLKKTDSHQ